MCAVMLDTKVSDPPSKQYPAGSAKSILLDIKALSMQGPEIRTGFLEDAKPIQLTAGKEVTLTTDYEKKGNSETIAVR